MCKRCLILAVSLLATVVTMIAPSTARAAVSFSFDVGSTNKVYAPNEVFTVDVSLIEILTDGSPSLLQAENGLTQAQFTLQRRDVSSVADPIRLTTFALNPAFGGDPSINNFGEDVLDVTQFVALDATSGPDGEDMGIAIHLGTLTFTAGSVLGDVTTFDVGDFPDFDETLTFANTVLDSQITPATFTVTIDSVPESSMTAYMLGCGIFLRRRRRQ